MIDHHPDYELDDVLVVDDAVQLRALAEPTRGRIVTLLNRRAASTTELAAALGMPKGTVGHHVKVLEKAGLVRIVRTRQVRALTEKYYGRVARLFVLKTPDDAPEDLRGGALTAIMLRRAADEAVAAEAEEKHESAIIHVQLAASDVVRFQRRLNRLAADFHRADDPGGEMHALTFALFRSPSATLPTEDRDA